MAGAKTSAHDFSSERGNMSSSDDLDEKNRVNSHEDTARIMIIIIIMGGAGSRVVKSLGCGARGPGFESR